LADHCTNMVARAPALTFTVPARAVFVMSK
jgi:hypothetical protein